MSIKNRNNWIDLGNYFSDKTETTIATMLKSVEGQQIRERSTRSNYYALKAEFRNYLLLKNLYLTKPTLSKARLDAGFNISRDFHLPEETFDSMVAVYAQLSRKLIFDLIERLKPTSQSRFKSDSFQIELQ